MQQQKNEAIVQTTWINFTSCYRCRISFWAQPSTKRKGKIHFDCQPASSHTWSSSAQLAFVHTMSMSFFTIIKISLDFIWAMLARFRGWERMKKWEICPSTRPLSVALTLSVLPSCARSCLPLLSLTLCAGWLVCVWMRFSDVWRAAVSSSTHESEMMLHVTNKNPAFV